MNDESGQSGAWRRLSWALLALVTAATLARGTRPYPVFVDAYYHMAVVEGFRQAGGPVLHDFWSHAPAGRPHIYAPLLHTVGWLATAAGATPAGFVAFASWAAWPLSLLLAWRWMRRVAGERAGFLALALLCGPEAWFFNQAAHNANAWALCLLLGALLAYDSGRPRTAFALAALAPWTHGIGLAAPACFALRAIHRPRTDGLRAGAIALGSAALFAPWALHVYAVRALVSKAQFGGDTLLQTGDFRVYLALMPLAAAGLAVAYARRGTRLAVPPLLGCFAVALPIGYAHRFWLFNSFLPYACLAALALDAAGEVLSRRRTFAAWAPVAPATVLALALLVDPVLVLYPRDRAGGPARAFPSGPGGPRPAAAVPPGPPGGPGAPSGPATPRPRFEFAMTALPKLLVGGPEGRRDQMVGGDFDAVIALLRRRAGPGKVVAGARGVAGSLLTGRTGCWSTGGMLREVQSSEPARGPRDADFLLIEDRATAGGAGPPPGAPPRPGPGGVGFGPRGAPAFREAPPGWRFVGRAEGWRLYANPFVDAAPRRPPAPVVGPVTALMLAALVLLASVADLLATRPGARLRPGLAGAALLLAAAALLLPIARAALRELRHPPAAPERPAHPPRPFA